jgi:hypothetical protein
MRRLSSTFGDFPPGEITTTCHITTGGFAGNYPQVIDVYLMKTSAHGSFEGILDGAADPTPRAHLVAV